MIEVLAKVIWLANFNEKRGFIGCRLFILARFEPVFNYNRQHRGLSKGSK